MSPNGPRTNVKDGRFRRALGRRPRTRYLRRCTHGRRGASPSCASSRKRSSQRQLTTTAASSDHASPFEVRPSRRWPPAVRSTDSMRWRQRRSTPSARSSAPCRQPPEFPEVERELGCPEHAVGRLGREPLVGFVLGKMPRQCPGPSAEVREGVALEPAFVLTLERRVGRGQLVRGAQRSGEHRVEKGGRPKPVPPTGSPTSRPTMRSKLSAPSSISSNVRKLGSLA